MKFGTSQLVRKFGTTRTLYRILHGESAETQSVARARLCVSSKFGPFQLRGHSKGGVWSAGLHRAGEWTDGYGTANLATKMDK